MKRAIYLKLIGAVVLSSAACVTPRPQVHVIEPTYAYTDDPEHAVGLTLWPTVAGPGGAWPLVSSD